MVRALAQEALAVEAGGGNFGDIVAHLGRSEVSLTGRSPVTSVVAAEAYRGLGGASWSR